MFPERRCSVAAALCSFPGGSNRPQSGAHPAAGSHYRNPAQSGKRVDPLHGQVQQASSPGAEPGPRCRDLDCFAGRPPVENGGISSNEWARLRRASDMEEIPEFTNWGELSTRPGERIGGSRQDPRRAIYGGWQARGTLKELPSLKAWCGELDIVEECPCGGKFRTRKDWFRVLTVPLLDEAESITSVSLVKLLEKRFFEEVSLRGRVCGQCKEGTRHSKEQAPQRTMVSLAPQKLFVQLMRMS